MIAEHGMRILSKVIGSAPNISKFDGFPPVVEVAVPHSQVVVSELGEINRLDINIPIVGNLESVGSERLVRPGKLSVFPATGESRFVIEPVPLFAHSAHVREPLGQRPEII